MGVEALCHPPGVYNRTVYVLENHHAGNLQAENVHTAPDTAVDDFEYIRKYENEGKTDGSHLLQGKYDSKGRILWRTVQRKDRYFALATKACLLVKSLHHQVCPLLALLQIHATNEWFGYQ